MHDHSLAPRNDASLLCGNLGTSGKIIMGYLARGSGIRAILLQSGAKFYNFFVFFSGDLKIAAGNFSKAEVLTSTLKMKSFSTRF